MDILLLHPDVAEEETSLKRALGSDHAAVPSHTCEYCSGFRIRPIPPPDAKDLKKQYFFRILSTRSQVKAIAESGCAWWSLFRNRIRYLDLLRKASKASSEDKAKRHKDRSDAEFEALSRFLPAAEVDEFLRLRRGPFGGAVYQYDGPWDPLIKDRNFVGIAMVYSTFYKISTGPVIVDVQLILPNITNSPGSQNFSSLKNWAEFLVLEQQPGQLARPVTAGLGSPINIDPGSPEAFALMRHWIKTCESKHDCGFQRLPDTMPKMVLDVDTCHNDHVKLVDLAPDAQMTRYIALSYCWGPVPQKTTCMKENLSTLCSEGISLDALDTTIQDAILVARELGFVYLWVDALCMIQDDDAFMGRELGRMAEIYRNATMTIAASRAAVVQEGFLTKRQPAGVRTPGQVFRCEVQEQPLSSSPVSAILIPKTNESFGIMDERAQREAREPWDVRAWTMQESILSGRRLDFGSKNTTWVCQCQESSYEASDGWYGSQSSSVRHDALFQKVTKSIWKTSAIVSPEEARDNWASLVGSYSNRGMTHKSDRLPAISALAREYGSLLGDEYLCGHWRSTLAQELTWFPRQDWRLTFAPGGSELRPTWSWASYEGGVKLQYGPNDVVDEHFKVMDCDITLKNPNNPYGEVMEASLTVQGILIHRTLFSAAGKTGPISSHTTPSVGQSVQFQDLEWCLEKSLYVNLDYPESDVYPRKASYEYPVPIVLMIVTSRYWGFRTVRGPTGLVLLEEGKNRFARIGKFGIRDIWATKSEPAGNGNKRSIEEYAGQLRSVCGGTENVGEIVLI